MTHWVKLWRTESARFRSMPLAARAIASYVLKFVDDHGALPLGHRDPVTAVAMAIGADASERRWLRPAVAALIGHGYLSVTEGLLVIGNFPAYQEGKPATPSKRERDAKPSISERETDASEALAGREISVSAGNDTLAQNVLLSEKKDIEKRESQNACAPEAQPVPRPEPPKPSAQAAHDELLSFADVQETFSRLRQAHCGATFKPSQRDYERVNQVRDAANGSGATRTERLTALTLAIRGYLASTDAWCVERQWPISGLNDYGRCLAAGRKLPQERPKTEQSPRDRLNDERRRLVALRGSGAWTRKTHDEQRVVVERLEAIERELGAS